MLLSFLLLLHCLLENGGTWGGGKGPNESYGIFFIQVLCSNHMFCTLDDYHPKMYWIFPTLHAKEQWRPQCLAKECDSVLGIFICLRFVPLRNPYFFSYQVSLFQEDYKQLAQHDSLWSFIACAPKKYEGSPVLEYSNMFSYCSVAYR